MLARSSNPEWNERYENRTHIGAPENPMSKYLNDLIKSLQAEAKKHEPALKDHSMSTGGPFVRIMVTWVVFCSASNP